MGKLFTDEVVEIIVALLFVAAIFSFPIVIWLWRAELAGHCVLNTLACVAGIK